MIPPTTVLVEKSVPDVDSILRAATLGGVRFARVRRRVRLHEEHLVLLCQEDRIPFADVLWQHGLRRRTQPGRMPVTYGCARGKVRGSVLVTTTPALRYGGRVPWLATPEPTERILSRARTEDGIPVIAPGDELLDIVLHCLLDRGAFPSRERVRLAGLLHLFRGDPPSAGALAELVQRELTPALPWGDLVAAIETKRWDTLLARRSALRRQLFLRAPLSSTLRLGWRLSGADRLSGHGVV